MRELSEHDKALLIGSTPNSDITLFCPGLQGRGTTLINRYQSGNGSNGTITGPDWVWLPRGIKVLRFNGAGDYVALGTVMSATETFSVKMWIKPFDLTTRYPLFGSDAINGFQLEINDVLGGGYTGRIGGLKIGIANLFANDTDNVLTTGWNHVIYVKNGLGATSICYLNGVSLALAVNTNSNSLWTGNFTIGKSGGLVQTFKGDICLPYVRSGVTSAAQALQNYIRELHWLGA